jgi:hypothetical protein
LLAHGLGLIAPVNSRPVPCCCRELCTKTRLLGIANSHTAPAVCPLRPLPEIVVLGTASEPEVQRQWEDMAREYGRGGDARLVLRYDEGLAHRIYAGADAILVGCLGLVGAGDRTLRGVGEHACSKARMRAGHQVILTMARPRQSSPLCGRPPPTPQIPSFFEPCGLTQLIALRYGKQEGRCRAGALLPGWDVPLQPVDLLGSEAGGSLALGRWALSAA